MRLSVDMATCQSYAQCCFLAPEAFAFQGEEALVYDPAPDDASRSRILQAAAACPVQAIHIDRSARPTHAARPPGTEAQHAVIAETEKVVIVGASLTGLRAAEAIRREGFTGRLVLIGAETHAPYDRPPLSKQVIAGTIDAEDTALPELEDLNAEWHLGVAAQRLDLDAKQVHLASGDRIDYDRLLIASGTRSRPWPESRHAALDGVFTVRTLEDARRLRERFVSQPSRVVVIGGGFTGGEVASVCRELDLNVTWVVRGAAPLGGAFGTVLGQVAGDIAEDHGVDVRCSTSVVALEGDDSGRLRGVRLSDGTTLEADVAVVATGAVRNVEWLMGSGLSVGPWGVTCDAGCRAFDLNGAVVDDIFVAGDIARFPHPLFGSEFLAMEHWKNAAEQAEVAAHNMVGRGGRPWAHLSVPVFWSIQFGHVLKSAGVPGLADQMVLAQGSVESRSFVAVYGRKGRIVGAVAMNQAKWLEHYREQIAQAAAFPPHDRRIDAPTELVPVSPGLPAPGSPWGMEQDSDLVVTGHRPDQLRASLRAAAASAP